RGVGVLGQEPPVHEREGVDVGGEVVTAAGDAAGDGTVQDGVHPHHAGKFGTAPVVVQQGGDTGLGLAEHERVTAAHPRVGEDLGGHRLGLVPAGHHLDGVVEPVGDVRGDAVGRG